MHDLGLELGAQLAGTAGGAAQREQVLRGALLRGVGEPLVVPVKGPSRRLGGWAWLICGGLLSPASPPVPGGRPCAEPGGGRASGAAQRRRFDLIRLNSATTQTLVLVL